jgi:two-component system LytT family response regulator
VSAQQKRIRTVIVDDEDPARRLIEQLLALDEEIEVCSSVRDGREALAALGIWKPDLLFLDIQMPEMDGFAVLQEHRRRHPGAALPCIVFVTAHDEFAVRAFDVHAVDYLLKPFGDERFFRSVAHAKQRIAEGHDQARLEELLAEHKRLRAGSSSERFVVRRRGHEIVLNYSDILWFEAADHYVLVHTADDSHIYRDTMKRLRETLDADRFARAHRGAIVSLEHIQELRSAAGTECGLILSNGVSIPVSRRRIQELRERLGG